MEYTVYDVSLEQCFSGQFGQNAVISEMKFVNGTCFAELTSVIGPL